MVVPITDVVKMTLSAADILVEPIIGTPLLSINLQYSSPHQFMVVALVDVQGPY